MKPPKHFQALALEVTNNGELPLPGFQNCKSSQKHKEKKIFKFSNVKKISHKGNKRKGGKVT